MPPEDPMKHLKPRLDALGVRPAVREAIARAIRAGKIKAVWNPVLGDYELTRGEPEEPKLKEPEEPEEPGPEETGGEPEETGGEPEEPPRAD